MLQIENDHPHQRQQKQLKKSHHKSSTGIITTTAIDNSTITESTNPSSFGGGGGGDGSNGNLLAYPFKYRNCRRSKLPTAINSQLPRSPPTTKFFSSTEEMLYNEPNLVPKMELLKINYINMPRKSSVQLKTLAASRSRASVVQDIKDDLIKKCGDRSNRVTDQQQQHLTSMTGNKSIKVPELVGTTNSKYAVYKKHNLHDQHSSGRPQQNHDGQQEKNSKVFDFDNVKFRKKYFLFDSKKRSKLDNIQFYFDNRSYERHVDNKLYGSSQRPSSSSQHHQKLRSIDRREQPPQPQQPQSNQSTVASKLSSWKDHLNNTRLGNVRELQNKYENRARQSSSTTGESHHNGSGNGGGGGGLFRLQQKQHHQHQKIVKETTSNHRDKSQYGIISDTDQINKLSSGDSHHHHHLVRDRGHHHRAANTRPLQTEEPSKKRYHQSGNMCSKRRESTSAVRQSGSSTENECNKIKRLVEDFEMKSPTTTRNKSSVEGRENFILFQRMNSANNLANAINGNRENATSHSTTVAAASSSSPSSFLAHKFNLVHGSQSKRTIITTTTASSAHDMKSKTDRETNYYLSGGGTRQQPLCKNIRTPRPTSMPIGSCAGSQMVVTLASDHHRSEKSTKHCGYKNCHFQNCPMTASSSSTSSGCDSSSSSTLSYCGSDGQEKFTASPINIVHRNSSTDAGVASPLCDHHPRTDHSFYVKTNHRNSSDCKPLIKSMIPKSRTERISNIKQLESRIVTKYISEELRLLHNSASRGDPERDREADEEAEEDDDDEENDDGYERISNRDPEPDYERNKVKIYVGGGGVGGGGVEGVTKQLSVSPENADDSDKDYGYYDQVTAESGSCSEDSYGSRTRNGDLNPQLVIQSKPKADDALINIMEMSSDLMGKLGCDGAIFWNENCYEEDCKVGQCAIKEPYICVCGSSAKVESPYSRPVEGGGTTTDSGVSISGDTISSPDSENTQQAAKPDELENQRLKRGHVLAELLETERIYVAEMGAILKGYRDQIRSEEMATMVPPQLLEGKEDVLFGNLHDLYQFHNDVFLKDLENCISTTELVALCFVQRRDTFYRLYSYYCQNIPRSEQLRETLVDTHLFLQECQKRLGHKLPLAAYLLKPVQRITKYQLLLKDLLRFSDNGTCAKELQKALDCMLIVLKCVNDSMHQIAITGFPADLSQQGELLLQDSFTVWTDSKKDLRLRMKTQQRHIFLYQKALLFCKHASKNGHNKSTYQYKHYVKMSQIGLTESVRGDARRFEIWLQGRQEVHTIQAISVEVKNKWVAEIKRVLFNQLEELKGEKIKQYGLNNKQLQHAASWDPTSTSGGPVPPKLSRDPKNLSIGETGLIPPNVPAELEGPEIIGASSSDYSNSEDEYTHIEEATPGATYLSMADYCAMSETEVSLKEQQSVELLKVGCAGWWFVKLLGGDNQEGWAPAAYLSPVTRNSHILTG